MKEEDGIRFIANHRLRDRANIQGKVTVHGLDCELVGDKQAEKSDLVICQVLTDPLLLPDNLIGPCDGCGDMLQWRPTSPKAPPKVCMTCAQIRMNQYRAGLSRQARRAQERKASKKAR